jgi:hypothetical protein
MFAGSTCLSRERVERGQKGAVGCSLHPDPSCTLSDQGCGWSWFVPLPPRCPDSLGGLVLDRSLGRSLGKLLTTTIA